MPSANEEDVVVAFRQAVEAEMRKLQSGDVATREDVLAEDLPLEEAVRRLIQSHNELAHEVALLRTIVLRLVSEPVDRNLEDSTA